jgi:hypothetical protein
MAETEGALFDPETGARIEPALLPLGAPDPDAAPSHAEQVAAFVLDQGHAMFYRNLANRTLSVMLGRGLVTPENDHRLSNPPLHGAVLDELTAELVQSRGDLRELVRSIATSRMYAVDSTPHDGDAPDVEFLARRASRPMSRATLRRSVQSVLGVELDPALELPASPLALQLALRNGDLLHSALASGATLVDAIAAFGGSPRDQLADVYKLVLSREPTERERRELLPSLSAGKVELRQLAFALLASREFGVIR